jgi:hypothetical protein
MQAARQGMRKEHLTPLERGIFAAFQCDKEVATCASAIRGTTICGTTIRHEVRAGARSTRSGAETLAWMLSTDPGTADSGKRIALRVAGAAIRGILDLDYAVVRYPLRLTGCPINDPLRLHRAHVRHIASTGCHLTHFYAANLEVDGMFTMPDCSVRSLARLSGARISALLVLDGTRIAAGPRPEAGDLQRGLPRRGDGGRPNARGPGSMWMARIQRPGRGEPARDAGRGRPAGERREAGEFLRELARGAEDADQRKPPGA